MSNYRAVRRHLANTVELFRENAKDRASEIQSSRQAYAAFCYAAAGLPRMAGATSAIIHLRKPEDIVVVSNSAAHREFSRLLETAKDRVDGADIVQDTENVFSQDWTGLVRRISQGVGDIWYDSCTPTAEVAEVMQRKSAEAGKPLLIIVTGFHVKYSK